MGQKLKIFKTVEQGLMLHIKAFLLTLPFALVATMASVCSTSQVETNIEVENMGQFVDAMIGHYTSMGIIDIGWTLFPMLVSIITYGMIVRVLLNVTHGSNHSYINAVIDGLKKIPKYFVLSIMITLIGILPFIILFLPMMSSVLAPIGPLYYVIGFIFSIYVMVKLCLAPILFMDKNDGIFNALKQSYETTSGAFWRIILVALISLAMLIIIGIILGIALGIIVGIISITGVSIDIFVAGIGIIIGTLIYAFTPSVLVIITNSLQSKEPNRTQASETSD